jgi:hypothetical protein
MAQTAHSLDPAKPATNLMSIDPLNWHRYPAPITRTMLARAYEPGATYTYNGGQFGDETVAESNVLVDDRGFGDYGPRTQTEKAAAMGVPIVTDLGVPRGYIDPQEPYGAAPVSPTDDPTISSLAPNTGVSGGSPIWVTITGTKFTVWSQVETGGVITPYTRYFSPTRIDMLQDPRSTPGTVVVKVIDHGVKSAGSNFTFT